MTQEPMNRVALIVDDEHFARLFAVQILLDRGFVVLEASTGAEALEMLQDNQDVSVLITDIAMPGEYSGVKLANVAAAAWPDLGIIYVSGHPQPELPQDGAQAFVGKPYTPRALLEALEAVSGLPCAVGSAPLPMTALGSLAPV